MSTFRKFWETQPRTDYFDFFRDFTNTGDYNAADWTATNAGSGAIAIDTDDVGGVLVLTGGAADDALIGLNNKLEVFQLISGKALEFEARFKLNDVVQSDFALGLQITDTTPLSVSNGIWFGSDDGDALLDFHYANASAQQDLNGVATLVNNSYIKVGFYYDGDPIDAKGQATLQVFINDNRVGAIKVLAASAEQLCVSIAVQNGEAVSKVMSVDYVRVVQQR